MCHSTSWWWSELERRGMVAGVGEEGRYYQCWRGGAWWSAFKRRGVVADIEEEGKGRRKEEGGRNEKV
jgi:hypothetical protein